MTVPTERTCSKRCAAQWPGSSSGCGRHGQHCNGVAGKTWVSCDNIVIPDRCSVVNSTDLRVLRIVKRAVNCGYGRAPLLRDHICQVGDVYISVGGDRKGLSGSLGRAGGCWADREGRNDYKYGGRRVRGKALSVG